MGEILIVDVGNLIFSASRWFQHSNVVEHLGIIHVDTGDRIARFRNFWLFLDPDDPLASKNRNTKTLRIGNFRKDHVRTPPLLLKLLAGREDVVFDKVVT